MKVTFHHRVANDEAPPGITVSRKARLPRGDFGITEYCWGPTSLWFVDSDRFSADERQAAFEAWRRLSGAD